MFLIIIWILAFAGACILGTMIWRLTGWLANTAIQPLVVSSHYDVSSSFLPDMKMAKTLAAEGQVDQAIKLANAEVAKQPGNYEGNLLLAQWYCDLGQFNKALRCLKTITENPDATDAQKEVANKWTSQVLG